MRYIYGITTIPPAEPDNALIMGQTVHTGIEKSLEEAIKEYSFSYPIITDEHINEIIKFETVIPLARAAIPPGGAFEVEIADSDFHGFIDYLVPVGNGYFDLYDFKYSNNVSGYKQSNQLHLYKYFWERNNPGKKIRNMYFLFIPKVSIRQKKTETLLDFRQRLKEELAGAEVKTVQIGFNPEKVIEFLFGIKAIKEEKDFPQNKSYSLDLKELGDRFKTAEMFGKLANIGDDIGDEFIANPAIFKKLVTGERVSAERKGQNPFEFNNYSKLLFSANNIPRIKDKTGAVQRRLTIIPFDARFSADDPDFNPYIKHLLKTDEVMEYLINLGIAGLKRVLLNRKFTGSTKVQKAMDEYEENNNPIIGFFRECEDEEFQIENEPTNVVYKRYQEYCLANSLQPMSNIEFSKQVNRILNMRVENKWLNGKKHRIFIKNE